MSEGSKCPNCGKAHAPWVATCDSKVVTWTGSDIETCQKHKWEYHGMENYHKCVKCGKRLDNK